MRKYLFGAQKYSKVLFPPYYIGICYVFLRNHLFMQTSKPCRQLTPVIMTDAT